MPARATVDTSRCRISSATVKAASTFTKYKAIKRNGAEVLDCAAGDAPDGYAVKTASPGEQGAFIAVNEPGIVEVLVGTGGATAGAFAKVVADGMADAGVLGGGTTLQNIAGKFVDTGVAGDRVGLMPMAFAAVKA
jgi:hypothetical protein